MCFLWGGRQPPRSRHRPWQGRQYAARSASWESSRQATIAMTLRKRWLPTSEPRAVLSKDIVRHRRWVGEHPVAKPPHSSSKYWHDVTAPSIPLVKHACTRHFARHDLVVVLSQVSKRAEQTHKHTKAHLCNPSEIVEAVAACLGIRFVLSDCKGQVLRHAVACGIVHVLYIVVR